MVHRDQKLEWQVSEKLCRNAPALRRDMAEAGRIIWYNVRAHRLRGASFRRQTPIGPYVVDFVCHEAKLIVEVVGGQHFEPENAVRDARGDSYLADRGYRILHFNNLGVMTNKSGVLDTVAVTLEKSPFPNLPPQAGEGTILAREQGKEAGRVCGKDTP